MKLRVTIERYLSDTSLTAAALAKKSGIPKATLAGWLAGNAPRDFTQLRALARVMGLTIDSLLFDDKKSETLNNVLLSEVKLGNDGWYSGQFEVKFKRIDRP